MSTRLTHHRRSLSDRLNAWLCQYADDRQIKRAQDAEQACERLLDRLDHDLEFHRNTVAEHEAARESIAHELDVEIALSRELGRRLGLGFPELCVLRVRVADQMRAEDERAEFDRIVSQMVHPSNGEDVA